VREVCMYKRLTAIIIAAFIFSLFPNKMVRAMGQVPNDAVQNGSEAPAPSKYPKAKRRAVEQPADVVRQKGDDAEVGGTASDEPSETVQRNGGNAEAIAPVSDSPGETVQEKGDTAAEEAAIPAEQSAEEAATSSPASNKLSVSKGNVSFFFDDVDMFEVIQSVFGDVLKVNYIIDSGVKGRVNFRTVSPIPKSEVLSVMETILRLNGVGFVEEHGLYRIVPIDVVPGERIYSQVGIEPGSVAMELITFKNLDIKYSMQEIENATGVTVNGAKVRVLPVDRLNGILVVASTKEQLEYVRKWVEAFDAFFEGSRPEVFVYPVQNSKAKDVVGVLQQIFLGKSTVSSVPEKESPQTTAAGKTSAQPAAVSKVSRTTSSLSGGQALVSDITRIFPDEIANTIIIYATPKDYELISKTITKIDVVPRQVMIEALVAEVTLTDKLKFGIEWFLKSGFKFNGEPLSGLTSFGSQQLSIDPAAPLALTGFSFAAIDAANVVKGLLQTLASESKLKVIASPHIMASDNREAKIQVGKQVPVQSSTSVTSGGETVSSIQYRDTGVVLKVKPNINEGGLVSLEISQEVSSVDPESGVGDNPIITNRQAETNVVIQSGQTVVIGGLIQENKGTSREGIPILKDIPLFGLLFGYTSDSVDRTELVVMITPRVVTSASEAKSMTDDFINRTEGLKDLPASAAKDLTAEDATGEQK